jgi:hypothetical protein
MFKGERDEGTPGQTGASARTGANTPKGGHHSLLCPHAWAATCCHCQRLYCCAVCKRAPLRAAWSDTDVPNVRSHFAVPSCIICIFSRKRYVTHIDCCSKHHTATCRSAGMNELQNPQTPTLPNALGGAALSLLATMLTSIAITQSLSRQGCRAYILSQQSIMCLYRQEFCAQRQRDAGGCCCWQHRQGAAELGQCH